MINKYLSIVSIIIYRTILRLYSYLYLISLKIRGMHGGMGLRVHFGVSISEWLCCLYMGKNVVLHKGVKILMSRNSSLVMKDRSWVSYYTIIIASTNAKIVIGENTMIGGNCMIVSADHNIRNKKSLRDSGHVVGNIIIGDNCWIGANSVITKGVSIGDGTIIGAGSIVTKDIPPMSIAVGAPARVIGYRELAYESENKNII